MANKFIGAFIELFDGWSQRVFGMNKYKRLISYFIVICFSFQSSWAISSMDMSHSTNTDTAEINIPKMMHQIVDVDQNHPPDATPNPFSHQHFQTVSIDCCDMCGQNVTPLAIIYLSLNVNQYYNPIIDSAYHTLTSLPALPPPIL